jgi:hypothetical protein
MPLWLTYLLLVGCALGLGFGFWLGSARGEARLPSLGRYATLFKLAVIAIAYLVVRPGAGDDGVSDIAAASAENKPIFVDLYSNF